MLAQTSDSGQQPIGDVQFGEGVNFEAAVQEAQKFIKKYPEAQ
jgi:hypothetical protein